MSKEQAARNNETSGQSAPKMGTETAESVAELKVALAEAQQKAAQNWDGYLRVSAELDNLRKRSQRDLESAHKYALERFLQELLPIKDSLEMGIVAASKSPEGLREGMEMTLKLLTMVLERFGVIEVNPIKGAAFDPEQQDAMTMQVSTDTVPGTVLQTVQKGYLLNERLLRPARVIVAKTPDAAA